MPDDDIDSCHHGVEVSSRVILRQVLMVRDLDSIEVYIYIYIFYIYI